MDEGATLVKTNKGSNDKNFHLGYEYYKDGQNSKKTTLYYACARYKINKCPGRLIYYINESEGNKFKVNKEHSHAADARNVGKAVTINNLKRSAIASPSEFGRNIIAKVTDGLDVATMANLGSTTNLLRTMRRVKVDKNLPSVPTNCKDLILTSDYINYKNEPFLLYDSGPIDNRILIFSTKRNLDYLKRADVWLIDGTFDVVPPIFSQLYTIQGRVDKWYVPLVYVLAPSKKKQMYDKVFQEISKHIPEAKPTYIISDFEVGAINSAKSKFPHSILHGCFFHFCQSIWRQVQALGLQVKYNTDAVFALHVRQLLALAFVPANKIPAEFNKLCETDFWRENEEIEDNDKVPALLNYFESTYIGIEARTKSKRRIALFPPSLWSVYEITILGLPRTNNAIEAWHGVIKKSFGGSHITIFKFLMKLHHEQKFQETRMAHIDAGHDPDVVPLKYRKLNARLLKIVNSYKNEEAFDIIDYLTKLAHNIEL